MAKNFNKKIDDEHNGLMDNLRANGGINLGETDEERKNRLSQEAHDLRKREVTAHETKAGKPSDVTIHNSGAGNIYNAGGNLNYAGGNQQVAGRDAQQSVGENTTNAKNDKEKSLESPLDTEATPESTQTKEASDDTDVELMPSDIDAEPTKEEPKPAEEKPAPDETKPELEPTHERPNDRYESYLEVPDINPAIQAVAEKYIKARRLDSIGDVRLEELENDPEFHRVMEEYRYVIGHNRVHDYPNASVGEIEAFLINEQTKQEAAIKSAVIARWDNGSIVRRFIKWKSEHPVLATLAIGGAVAVVGTATAGFGLAGVAGASVGGAIGVGAAKGGLFGLLGSRQSSSQASIHGAWRDDNNPEGHTAEERRHGQYMALAEAFIRGLSQEEMQSLITETVNRDAFIIRENAYRDRTKNRSKTAGGVAVGAIIGGAVGGIVHGLNSWQHEVSVNDTRPTSTTEMINNGAPQVDPNSQIGNWTAESDFGGTNTWSDWWSNQLGIPEEDILAHRTEIFQNIGVDPDTHQTISFAGNLSDPLNNNMRAIGDYLANADWTQQFYGAHEVTTQGLETITSSSTENILNEYARNVANIAADTLTAAAAFAVGDRIAKGGGTDHPTAPGGPVGESSNRYGSVAKPKDNNDSQGQNDGTRSAEITRTGNTQTNRPRVLTSGAPELPQTSGSEMLSGNMQESINTREVVNRIESDLNRRYAASSREQIEVANILGEANGNIDTRAWTFEGTRATGRMIRLTDVSIQRLKELLRQGITDFSNEDNLRRIFGTEKPQTEDAKDTVPQSSNQEQAGVRFDLNEAERRRLERDQNNDVIRQGLLDRTLEEQRQRQRAGENRTTEAPLLSSSPSESAPALNTEAEVPVAQAENTEDKEFDVGVNAAIIEADLNELITSGNVVDAEYIRNLTIPANTGNHGAFAYDAGNNKISLTEHGREVIGRYLNAFPEVTQLSPDEFVQYLRDNPENIT